MLVIERFQNVNPPRHALVFVRWWQRCIVGHLRETRPFQRPPTHSPGQQECKENLDFIRIDWFRCRISIFFVKERLLSTRRKATAFRVSAPEIITRLSHNVTTSGDVSWSYDCFVGVRTSARLSVQSLARRFIVQLEKEIKNTVLLPKRERDD